MEDIVQAAEVDMEIFDVDTGLEDHKQSLHMDRHCLPS